MLREDEIKQFIEDDRLSEKKRLASIGKKYYDGLHDIRNYRLFYYNADGNLVEDRSRSNIKISHPFFTEIVDQAVQYMLSGKNGYVKSDDPELQRQLDLYFNNNETFTSELYEMLTDCMVKGYSYMYMYKGADDRLTFQCADSMGVIEVRAKDTDDHCEHVIYWYVDRIAKGRKAIKRIQVWDDKQIYFYVQDGDGKIQKDYSVDYNPKPHVVYTQDGQKYGYGLGYIPFFRLDNCKEQVSSLHAIKGLIDDYDLMSCGLSNNLQDASEYLVVVKGYAGENLDELQQNIKVKKMIGVDGDENGGVDFKTVDIPYQARKAKMDEDEKNIYRFGFAFNSAQVGDGNITNIVIKSRYALLDMKCNKLEIKLKEFMRKIVKVVLQEINEKMNAHFTQADVYFDFTREVMTNAADNAQIELIQSQTRGQDLTNILNVASKLDNDTIVKNICQVLELNYEEIMAKVNADSAEGTLKAIEQIETEE